MSKSNAKQAVSMRTAASVIVVVLVLIGFGFLMLQQVNFLVGRSLLIAFGNGADSTYKGAWFQLNGDLVAKDFVLKPYGPDVDVTLRFKRVHVETPGWLWLVGTMRSRKLIADIDRLHVTLSEGTSDGGVDPSLGDLGPFGTDTASPFEAEGCLKDSVWLRSELVEMGLKPGPTTLDFDYRIDGQKLETRIVLATPGVSRVTMERHETVPAGTNPFLLDITQTQTTDEHWLVQDEGFVKARNAYCAKRDGVTDAELANRHVQAVARLLAAQGLALDADSLAAYAGFARNGGQFSFGGTYISPLPSEIFYEARDSGMAFTRMNGIIERDGRKLAAQWTKIAPRPLDDKLTTYEAIMQEQGVAAPNAGVPAAVAFTTPVPTTSPTIATAAPAPAATAAAPVAAQPIAAPTPSAAAGAFGSPRAFASSLPSTAPAAKITGAKPGDAVPWKELSKYVGHRLEITTARISTREVTLLEASAVAIRVEGSVVGGHVENRIYQDGFLRAVLLD